MQANSASLSQSPSLVRLVVLGILSLVASGDSSLTATDHDVSRLEIKKLTSAQTEEGSCAVCQSDWEAGKYADVC